jgi:hypothetical protein
MIGSTCRDEISKNVKVGQQHMLEARLDLEANCTSENSFRRSQLVRTGEHLISLIYSESNISTDVKYCWLDGTGWNCGESSGHKQLSPCWSNMHPVFLSQSDRRILPLTKPQI